MDLSRALHASTFIVGLLFPGIGCSSAFALQDVWVVTGISSDVPLAIFSNLGGGSITQTPVQDIYFLFDAAVTGFDVTDATVTGATKGAFSPLSDRLYALSITATGGTVTINVPSGAADAKTGIGHSLQASLSNFYQDTWVLDLPGSIPMELIRIPAGTFTMGSPVGEESHLTNEPEHAATLSRDFYIGKTEVTQAQWLAVRGTWPGITDVPTVEYGLGNNFPVYFVSHVDIQTFLAGLDTAIQEPGTFTLPTESQWEYAARAGTRTRYNFGNGLGANETCSDEAERTDNMWYCGNNSPNGTKVVGQKPANQWGLHDMHGGVAEWCADWYGTSSGPATDPTGPVSGTGRVYRGGGWSDVAMYCRSAKRSSFVPTTRYEMIGFRVVASRP